jgi:hypothetical protein
MFESPRKMLRIVNGRASESHALLHGIASDAWRGAGLSDRFAREI